MDSDTNNSEELNDSEELNNSEEPFQIDNFDLTKPFRTARHHTEEKYKSGEFDEDAALHISGIDVIGSTTQENWKGASLKVSKDANPDVARAHVTCPHCAAKCTAGAGTCWNCGLPLHE